MTENAVHLPISPEWSRSTRNRQWARALDGRTVWSHCLWVGLSQGPVVPDLLQPAGGPQLCCGAVPVREVASAHDEVGDVRVFSEAGEPNPADRRVVDALALLSATRMLTFPLLAGGQVVIAAAGPHASHALLELQERWDADDTATNILALSSRTVLQSWYDALEEEGADQTLRPVRDVARLLSSCLAHEYYVRRIRSASDAPVHETLEQRRDRLAGQLLEFTPHNVFIDSPNESVVAELVSYYYPHWDRRYFAFHSPWDNFRLDGR